MDGNAVSSATDFRNVKFANEDLPHINDDVTLEDRKGEQQQFIRQLDDRMRRAAVIFVKCVREHDSISDDLQQLSYDGIKAKAEANRQANQLAQQQRQQMEKKYAGIA
jgi:septation ring formation regulator EzrA